MFVLVDRDQLRELGERLRMADAFLEELEDGGSLDPAALGPLRLEIFYSKKFRVLPKEKSSVFTSRWINA